MTETVHRNFIGGSWQLSSIQDRFDARFYTTVKTAYIAP